MKEASSGARDWTPCVRELGDRTFTVGVREHVGKQEGPPAKGCTGLWELCWAFKEGYPRGENRPSSDIITTPVVLAPSALPKETQK